MSGRKTFIDLAKGIGIILVIIVHLGTEGQFLRHFICSFIMPAFFLMSGLFINTSLPFKEYLKKCAKTIYLPYSVFCLIDFALFASMKLLKGANPFSGIGDLFLTLIGVKLEVVNLPLYFLFSLFLLQIIFYFLNKSKIAKFTALALSIVFVAITDLFVLPNQCQYIITIPCYTFYCLGNIFKNEILKLEQSVKKNKLLFSCVLLALVLGLVLLSKENVRVDYPYYQYGNWILWLLNSSIGTISMLIFAILLDDIPLINKALIFYGKNSIFLLVGHYYLSRQLLEGIMEKAGLIDIIYKPYTQATALVAILIIMIPFCIIANRYFGFIFGKTKKAKE